MSKKTVALLLKSPLQAWGIDSRFESRTTFSHPTKSAIAGMVCAAMGIDKYSPNANAELAKICEAEYAAYAVVPADGKGAAKFASTPYLSDYHTVGGGYSKRNPLHLGFALGFKGDNSEAIITKRLYIQDSCFVALLTCPDELAERIAAAIKNPKWGVWLGRKACIPSIPVFGGVFDSAEEALKSAIEKLGTDAGKAYIATCGLHEAEDFNSADTSIPDIPKDFRNREFVLRKIAIEQ